MYVAGCIICLYVPTYIGCMYCFVTQISFVYNLRKLYFKVLITHLKYVCDQISDRVLSTQNTPIHIMLHISFCVCYSNSVSFTEFLRNFCIYDEIVLGY